MMPRGVPGNGYNSGWFKPGQGKPKSALHRQKISEAQRRAWETTRERRPIGTTRLDAKGYRRVKVVRGTGRWVNEHALVIEELIGRKLTRAEVVHHVNGDRADNRPANLFLCRNNSHHNAVHRSQDAAFRKLLAAGYVTFKDGKYEAVL